MSALGFKMYLSIARDCINDADYALRCRRALPETDHAGRLIELFTAIRWAKAARSTLRLAQAELPRKGGAR